jgi:signal recognition particle receptor subunit beta
VVDAADQERVEESKLELHADILSQADLRGCPLLAFATKQDLPNVRPAVELRNKLVLEKLVDRQWFVQPCTAIAGTGLSDGLEWLAAQFAQHNRHNRGQA